MYIILSLLAAIIILLRLRWVMAHPKNTLYDCYTIEKGDHYSYTNHDPIQLRWKLWPTFKKRLEFKVIFGLGCNYGLKGPDQADVNKLYGLQFGWSNQRASARVGWRYVPSVDGTRGKIELLAYIHDGKNRVIEPLDYGLITIGEACELKICLVKDGPSWFVDYLVNGHFEHTFPLNTKPWRLKFKQFPYFGGNQTAPKLMKIFIKEKD